MGRLARTLEAAERRLIGQALQQQDGNLNRAAGYLGVSDAELHKKAKKYGFPVLTYVKRGKKKIPRMSMATLPQAVAALELRWMKEGLKASGGEIKQAAILIGMDRSQFRRRMKQFGIKAVSHGSRAAPRPRQRDIRKAVVALKKEMISKALQDSDDSVSEAILRLGVERSTMYRMLERFGFM